MASRPDVLVVYGLYLVMFATAGLLTGIAFRRYRRSEATIDDLPEMGAIRPPARGDSDSGEEATETSTEHGQIPSGDRATVVADDRAAGLFRLADVTNPDDSGTLEHDAWSSGDAVLGSPPAPTRTR